MLVVAAMGGAACRSPSAGETVDLGASLQYAGPVARKQDKEAGPIEELSPTGTTCSNWDVPGDCDDRHKMYEESPPVVQKMAPYTITFLDNQARKDGRLICKNGKCRIVAQNTVHEDLECQGQDGKVRFGDAKAFAVCSGLLIEANGFYYGLTANHCIKSDGVQPGSPAIVGVYSRHSTHDALSEIPESWVFTVEGQKPVGQSHHSCYGSNNFGPDWAVVRLVPSNPKISAAHGVPMDSLVSAETPQDNRCDRRRELCVISHSLKTEATWACSSLYKTRVDGYWVTGLDFYRKGSGAPVWTEKEAKVAFVGLGVCSFKPVDACDPDCRDFGPANLNNAVNLPAYPDGSSDPSLGTWVSPIRATTKSELDALAVIREDLASQEKAKGLQRNRRRSRDR